MAQSFRVTLRSTKFLDANDCSSGGQSGEGEARLYRGNSTIAFTILRTLMLREHNRTAVILEKQYGWDDERTFQTNRNILTVNGTARGPDHHLACPKCQRLPLPALRQSFRSE